MTISSTNRKAGPFIGNGSASVFAFSFRVFAASDLEVVRITVATGVETTLTINSAYTVSLNADQNSNPGGSITLTGGALASGYNLIITSDIANLQPTDLTNQGGFYPEVITGALDRATIQIQQLDEHVNRTLAYPITDPSLGVELPAVGQRKGTVLAFNATTGAPEAGPSIGATNTVSANTADINTVAANIADVNIVAGNIGAVTGAKAMAQLYQGAKASNPALRNSGDALETGDLYFNTSNDRMRVYETGTGWIDYEATAQTAATTATTQAGTATTQAGIATAQATTATTQATLSTTAKTAAETARDAAIGASLSVGAYTNTTVAAAITAALAATTTGQYFHATGDDVTYIGMYQNNAGAALELARLPKKSLVDSKAPLALLNDSLGVGTSNIVTGLTAPDTTSMPNTNITGNNLYTTSAMIIDLLQVRLSAAGVGKFYFVDRNRKVLKIISAPGLQLGLNSFTDFDPFLLPAGHAVFYQSVSGGLLRMALGVAGDSAYFDAVPAVNAGDRITVLTSYNYQIALAMSGKLAFEPMDRRVDDITDSIGETNYPAGSLAATISSTNGGVYRVNAANVLYQERASPTTPADADTEVIGTVVDASANTYNLTAPSDAERPTYLAREVGNSVGMLFDGSNDVLTNTTLATAISNPANGVTMTVAFKANSVTTTGGIVQIGRAVGSDVWIGVYLGYFIFISGASLHNIAPADTSPHVITVTHGFGLATVWMDGVKVFENVTAGGSYTCDRIGIGALNRTTISDFFSGYIGSVAIIASKLENEVAIAHHQEIYAEVFDVSLGYGKAQRQIAAAKETNSTLQKRIRSVANRSQLALYLTQGTGVVVFAWLFQSNAIGRATFDSGTPHPAGTAQWGRTGANNNKIIAATTVLDHTGADAGDMSPSISFSIDFAAAFPGVQLLHMPGAVGGTGFSTNQWKVGDSLYNDAVARINRIFAQNPDFAFGGFILHGGETDAINSYASFQTQWDALITGLRQDVLVADDRTPVVVGELPAGFVSTAAGTPGAINTIILATPSRLPNVAVASSTSPTVANVFDNIHFDAAGTRLMGSRDFSAWRTVIGRKVSV